MKQLTFIRGIGKYKAGETHDVENDITAQHFLDNAFATEVIEDCGCGCNEKKEVEETIEVVNETVVKEKKEKVKK